MSTTTHRRKTPTITTPTGSSMETTPSPTATAAPFVRNRFFNKKNSSSSSRKNRRSFVAFQNQLGTSPSDKYWFNSKHYCGIICSLLTYLLHMYSMYVITFILLPSWMMNPNNNGVTVQTNHTTNLFRHIQEDSTIQDEERDDTHKINLQPQQYYYKGYIHCFLFITITVLALWSHFHAMTTNPGAVPPNAQPLVKPQQPQEEDEEDPFLKRRRGPAGGIHLNNLCPRCSTYKPIRAHHCSICKRCIVKMDHHCPWINNCVGIDNHKYFLLFVFYTFLSCVYTIVLLLYRFYYCMVMYGDRNIFLFLKAYNLLVESDNDYYNDDENDNNSHHHRKLLAAAVAVEEEEEESSFTTTLSCFEDSTANSDLCKLFLLFIEGLLFGSFTLCMLVEQIYSIYSKTTKIDRYKNQKKNTSSSSLRAGSSSSSNSSSSTRKQKHSSSCASLYAFHQVFGYYHIKNTKDNNNTKQCPTFLPFLKYYHWFLPCIQVMYPSQTLKDEIMGYTTITIPSTTDTPCMVPTTTNNNDNHHHNETEDTRNIPTNTNAHTGDTENRNSTTSLSSMTPASSSSYIV